jgi:two-component system sensor histidine kinase YesM
MARRRFLDRLKSFIISAGIIKTIKTSHIVIIFLLLVPLILSMAVTLFNTVSYDRLISNVDKTNRLNQIVKTEIINELWDIVAGNKLFGNGEQYRIINRISYQIEDIMSTTSETQNRRFLEVANRALDTLTRYVNRLGSQMENNYPVIENERMLDEIRGVSTLISEILQDFIVIEIESAAAANRILKQRAVIIATVELAVIVFAVLFSVFVRTSVAKSIDKSIGALLALSRAIAEGNLDTRADVPHVKELETLTEDLNTMAGKIKTLIEENVREQRNRQKSEMKALQAQITPHFLYNTMDSIVWLAESNRNEQVISITRAFSDFFRISLNRGNEWVRVQDEFKHIESYLTIQKIRYRDILDYSIEYEKEMEEKIMLKLLLQPLVENAIYHGIKNKRGRGLIKTGGWQEGGFLYFSIEDNGIGMTDVQLALIKEQMRSPDASVSNGARTANSGGGERPGSAMTSSPLAPQSFGLYNICKRLELYYNRTGLLDIQSVYKEGTKVTLKIPAADHV